LIVTAAAEAGCTMLLSEDMQDGFVTRGLTVANPLRDTLHSKLAGLIERPTMAARLAWNCIWNIERRGGGVWQRATKGRSSPLEHDGRHGLSRCSAARHFEGWFE